MSTADPTDGLTDQEYQRIEFLLAFGRRDEADWIRRLARENAALKAERDALADANEMYCRDLAEIQTTPPGGG